MVWRVGAPQSGRLAGRGPWRRAVPLRRAFNPRSTDTAARADGAARRRKPRTLFCAVGECGRAACARPDRGRVAGSQPWLGFVRPAPRCRQARPAIWRSQPRRVHTASARAIYCKRSGRIRPLLARTIKEPRCLGAGAMLLGGGRRLDPDRGGVMEFEEKHAPAAFAVPIRVPRAARRVAGRTEETPPAVLVELFEPSSPTRPHRSESVPRRRSWIADAAVSSCRSCARRFTLFLRRHHCRRCGSIFCNDCSNNRVTHLRGADDHNHYRLWYGARRLVLAW